MSAGILPDPFAIDRLSSSVPDSPSIFDMGSVCELSGTKWMLDNSKPAQSDC